MSNSLPALWVGESTRTCPALATQPVFLSVLGEREVAAPLLCPVLALLGLAQPHKPSKIPLKCGEERAVTQK